MLAHQKNLQEVYNDYHRNVTIAKRAFQSNINYWPQSSDFVLGFWRVIHEKFLAIMHQCAIAAVWASPFVTEKWRERKCDHRQSGLLLFPKKSSLSCKQQKSSVHVFHMWLNVQKCIGIQAFVFVLKDAHYIEMRKNQTFHFDLQIHPTLLDSTRLYCQMTGFIPIRVQNFQNVE